MWLLALSAKYGRLILVAGLLAGLALPKVGQLLAPWLPQMIAVLLFLAALRIGPEGLLAGRAQIQQTLLTVGALQIVVPLTVVCTLLAAGWLSSSAALAVVLVTAAAPLAGSPNLAIMTGGDPAPALRLLIAGTALLPLTVLPVFALSGIFGEVGALLHAVLQLLALIALAAVCAVVLHRWLMRGAQAVAAVDGLSALMMAVVVVGLMMASAEALRSNPLQFAMWLGFACAVNLGLQTAAALAMRSARFASRRIPVAIIAGNRNIALFLVALPPDVAAPLMLFIGCYQIPMYLTPYVMAPLHRYLG